MAIGEIDIAAQVNAAVTRELARMTAELQASSYENIGQGGSRGHSVDWFDASDDASDGASEMDYSDFAFGFSISGAVVTVTAGYLFHGTRTAISVAGGDKTVSVDHTWFYVNYVFGSGSATLATVVGSIPKHTETTLKFILYEARLIAGVVAISDGDIHHLGSITIPGSFA